MGYFEIKKRRDGQVLLNLKSSNGMTILTTEGYTSAEDYGESMEAIKKNAINDACYDIKETADRKFYFDLKAANGNVIGKSGIYMTKAAAGRGVDAVKRNAPDAFLKE